MRPVWDLPLSPVGLLVELDTGERVCIRPVAATDKPALLAAFERFSEESRYMRFFGPRPRLGDDMASRLTHIDHVGHLAWAVFDPQRPSEVGDGSGLAIAVARIIADVDDPTVAECALAVVDEYQKRGLGRFLIELALATAAGTDVEVLRFEVLRSNPGMRHLLSNLRATSHDVEGDPSVIEYRLDVPSLDQVRVPAGALYALLRRAAANDTAGDQPLEEH